MDWQHKLTKTPYLVLFIFLISIGVGTASALITITLSGDVIITGFLDMTGDKIANVDTPTLSSDAATKGYVDSVPSTDTLALLGCVEGEIAKLVGNTWTCAPDVDTDTLASIGCGTNQAAIFNGNNWFCVTLATQINPVIIIDSAGVVGFETSIAIGTDGNPVISYRDKTNFDLKVGVIGITSG